MVNVDGVILALLADLQASILALRQDVAERDQIIADLRAMLAENQTPTAP